MERKQVYDRLWRYIFSIFGHIDDFKQNLEPNDCFFSTLTVGQTRVLRVVRGLLDDEPTGITLKDLAAKLKISAASASEMVDVLVRKGMLCRSQSPSDRRAIAIDFSDDLKRSGRQVEDIFASGIADLCGDLSDGEIEHLEALLNKLHRRAVTAAQEK